MRSRVLVSARKFRRVRQRVSGGSEIEGEFEQISPVEKTPRALQAREAGEEDDGTQIFSADDSPELLEADDANEAEESERATPEEYPPRAGDTAGCGRAARSLWG